MEDNKKVQRDMVDSEYERILKKVSGSIFYGLYVDVDDMKQLVVASYHQGLADGIAREREDIDYFIYF